MNKRALLRGRFLVVEISQKKAKFGRIEEARRDVAPPGKEDAMDASTYFINTVSIWLN